MKNAVEHAGWALSAVGILLLFVALFVALAGVCSGGAEVCIPGASGTPWLIWGSILFVVGFTLFGWSEDR